MWPRRSHTLPSLTRIMSNKSKFEWAEVEQDSFDKINRIVARNTLLNYPGFNEIFKINTDANKLQLGVVINQKGKHIYFYSI